MSSRRLEGGGGIRCAEMGIVSPNASSCICVQWKPDGARGPHSFIRNFLMFWQRNGFVSVGENKTRIPSQRVTFHVRQALCAFYSIWCWEDRLNDLWSQGSSKTAYHWLCMNVLCWSSWVSLREFMQGSLAVCCCCSGILGWPISHRGGNKTRMLFPSWLANQRERGNDQQSHLC